MQNSTTVKEIPVIKISNKASSSPVKPKNAAAVIDLCYSTSPESNHKGTPLRTPIACLKNRETVKEMEEREDCFILGFNPDDDPLNSVANMKNLDDPDDDASPDVSVVAEKGQVACRDYPHSRHLCLKYPFAKTPHESYCDLCYCFVCDTAAPCTKWTGSWRHCSAMDSEAWKLQRKSCRRSTGA